MEQSEVAKRYAEAMVSIDGVDRLELEGNLERILKAFDQEESLKLFYESPRIDSRAKHNVLDKAFSGKIGQYALNLLHVLVEKDRESLLAEIYEAIVIENNRYAGRIRAFITTAVDISQDESITKDIQQNILSVKDRFGLEKENLQVSLVPKVNKDLLGGIIIRIDDYLWDASVSTQLKRLKTNMKGKVVKNGWE